MIALLNTSILTSFGDFSYREISKEEAIALLKSDNITSYIRHEGIIRLFSEDYGIEIPFHSGMYTQQSGEKALIFKLRNTTRGFQELDAQQVRDLGFDFGLLVKI